MKIPRTFVLSVVVLGLLQLCCHRPVAQAALPPADLPPVLLKGFSLFPTGGPESALEMWRQGGLLEGDRRAEELGEYFKRTVRSLRNYRSYELVESKFIGQSSRIVYLAILFERGAIYARFQLFKSDRQWVVQNMDFNLRPEAVMPWLAFEGGN